MPGEGRLVDLPRPRLWIRLAAILLILALALVTVRLLDGRRDQHNALLVSMLSLGDLFNQEDAATTSLVLGPSANRASELHYSVTQVDQRLPYLRRQGMSAKEVARLTSLIARYRHDAAVPVRSSADMDLLLSTDAAAVRAEITRETSIQKAAYARYDRALDTLTVVILVVPMAVIILIGGRAWVMARRPG
jgi:hypothetical protein